MIEVASNMAITNGHAPVLQVVRVFYTWRSNHSLQAIRQHIEKSWVLYKSDDRGRATQ